MLITYQILSETVVIIKKLNCIFLVNRNWVLFGGLELMSAKIDHRHSIWTASLSVNKIIICLLVKEYLFELNSLKDHANYESSLLILTRSLVARDNTLMIVGSFDLTEGSMLF